MTQKVLNKKLSIILKWLNSDFVLFSKVYNRYKAIFEKKYQNDFNHYFLKLLEVWENLTKTEYMHVLTTEEKVNKLEIQAMQFL